MPKLRFMDETVDDTAIKAEQILNLRIIRAGKDAWQEIAKAESFDAWERIGAALTIGKAHALRMSHANAPWGQNYCREFSRWAKEYGFSTMRSGDRSYAIALHENIGAITAWRATLSDKQRSRLTTAQGNVRKWQASIEPPRNGQCSSDLAARATRHWRCFLDCMRALPPEEREALWNASLAELMVPNPRTHAHIKVVSAGHQPDTAS
jgi:hypothetical protein